MERECIGRDGWHQWLAKWRPYEHWVCVFCILSIWNFFVSASYVSCIFITSWILGFSWLIHSSLHLTNSFFLLPMFTWHILQVSSTLFVVFFFLLQHSFVFSAKQQMHIASHSQNIQFFHSNISCRCVIIVNSMEIASFEQFTRINMSPFSPVFSEAPELWLAIGFSRPWSYMKLCTSRCPIFSSALLSLQCQGSPFGVAFLFVDLSSVLP